MKHIGNLWADRLSTNNWGPPSHHAEDKVETPVGRWGTVNLDSGWSADGGCVLTPHGILAAGHIFKEQLPGCEIHGVNALCHQRWYNGNTLDLALVQPQHPIPDLVCVELAEDPPWVGDVCEWYGLDSHWQEEHNQVTVECVTDWLIFTTAPHGLDYGDSGGPLLDKEGKLAGVLIRRACQRGQARAVFQSIRVIRKLLGF